MSQLYWAEIASDRDSANAAELKMFSYDLAYSTFGIYSTMNITIVQSAYLEMQPIQVIGGIENQTIQVLIFFNSIPMAANEIAA